MLSFHVIGSQFSGGAERFYMRLIQALHRRGEQVVAVNRPGSAVSAGLGPEIRQLHAPFANMWDLFRAGRSAAPCAASGPPSSRPT